MNRRWLIAGTAAALLCVAADTAAQTPATGAVDVVVEDLQGARLPDVRVELTPVTGGAVRTGMTSRDRVHAARLLTPGIYTVLVERLGYEPVRIEDVPVQAGRRVVLRVRLERTEGVVEAPRVVRYRNAVTAASRPGAGRYFDARLIAEVPERDRLAVEVLRLGSMADEGLAAEGLPARLGGLVVDGVLHPAVGHPSLDEGSLRALVYPLAAPVQLELAAGRPDLQWPAAAGALLGGITAPGPAEGAALGGVADGAWESRRFSDEGLDGIGGFRGGFALGGTFMNDSARVRVYGSALGRDDPVDRWPAAADGSGAAALLLEAAGLDPAAASRRTVGATRSMHVGGRFDWAYGEARTVELSTHYAMAERQQAPRSDLPGPAPVGIDGSDLLVAAASLSRLSERWNLEVRGGFGRSVREYGEVAEPDRLTDGAAVLLSEAGMRIGADPAHRGRFERSDIRAVGTLHMDAESYLLQLGIGGSFSSHDRRYGFGRSGVYAFGDAADLADRTGSFFRLEGPEPAASFSTQRFHVFGQSTWQLADGFDVRTGLRYDMALLPTGDLRRATTWLERTGIDNTAAPRRVPSIGVVAGFEWDVEERQDWLVRGDLTLHSGEVPPELLAEALTFDGRQTVRRAAGDLAGLDGAEAGAPYTRLTVIGPDFQAPVTTRASLGLARALGASTALLVSGVIRQTENLPARTDLNRATEPLAVDQHGRRVFGVPRLAGGLIVPEPGTSRRFVDYDVVSGIVSTATSDYFGLTVALERRGTALDLTGSYTFSSTTDDWVGAAAGYEGADLSPFGEDDVENRQWRRATSDFDVPHRLALMASAAVPGLPALRIGGALRYESGRPFTPGYAPGMDLTGLGVAGNDPAFIDDALDGMDELIGRWDCLRQSAGRFAPRNACRAPDRTALDLRLQAGVLRRAGLGADLVVEALNVMHSGYGWIDTALLLLDPEGAADLDISDGAVTFPFRVNPGFGESLSMESPRAFQLRAGLQVRF